MNSKATTTPQRAFGSPAQPRDEAAIKHKMMHAITEADYLLVDLYERQTEDDKKAISRVRGLLAGWRLGI